MNVHKNARLTPMGRELLAQRIESGWTVVNAAAAAGVSTRTASKWLARHRLGAERRHYDRSSAPRRCPHAIAPERVAQIEALRRQRMTGLQIASRLGMARSTVGAILRRIGLGRLDNLEPKPPVQRYEYDTPGGMIHIDMKKLGRIEGIGHRITGSRTGKSKTRGIGWEVLHVAIDDASRLAYTEVLSDEKKETACAFTARAIDWFARHGVTTQRLMSDNGSAYKSHLFAALLRERSVKHVRTRPYTPRTNGKAERFIQTSLREWAYAEPYLSSNQRTQAMTPFINRYNLTRPHSAHKGISPWQRLNNLLGFDT